VTSLQAESGADFFAVSTNKPYAEFHLEGFGVPKRSFFEIDRDKVLEEFGDVLLQELSR